MTESMIHDYVRKRMAEMGHPDFLIRHRHLILDAHTTTELSAHGELYLILGELEPWLTVSSVQGIYNTGIQNTSELQHEHTGVITIQNQSVFQLPLQLMQVTPKNSTQLK